jgi:ubiquinone/menaquinone biosynthesis C-methylase UbiE
VNICQKLPCKGLKPVEKAECEENNKSIYCDYNETFTAYDQIRHPHGAKELLDIFSQSPIPLQDKIVLEGGFGTGAYLDILRHHVGILYGIEGSDEGFQQAKLKTQDSENINLQLGDILNLPFPDQFFDAYTVNQVLHHLDSGYPFFNMDIFLNESNRVLKSGGQLTINTCSQEQLDPDQGAYWHYKYIPSAAYLLRSHYLPIEGLIERLESRKFTDIKQPIPSEKIFYDEYYENPEIALRPDFKKGDSCYSLLSETEIEVSDNRLKAAIDDGSVYDKMKRASARAAEIGEALILSAFKTT